MLLSVVKGNKKKETMYKEIAEHPIPESLIGATVTQMAKRMEWVYITGILTYASKMNNKYWYKHIPENKERVKTLLKEYNCEFTTDEHQVNISPFFESDDRGFRDPKSDVYVIGNMIHNLFKVGYSSDIDDRIKTIQTASPFELSVVKIFKNKGYNFEQHLQNYLQEYHKRGEWFELDIETLQDILDEFSGFER